jgi:hypothetical protein
MCKMTIRPSEKRPPEHRTRLRQRMRGTTTEYKTFVGQVTSLVDEVKQFQQGRRSMNTPEDYARIKARTKELGVKLDALTQDGAKLYEGFNPKDALAVRGTVDPMHQTNVMERAEFKLHKCMRELDSIDLHTATMKRFVRFER